jgi:hypothetical protein
MQVSSLHFYGVTYLLIQLKLFIYNTTLHILLLHSYFSVYDFVLGQSKLNYDFLL